MYVPRSSEKVFEPFGLISFPPPPFLLPSPLGMPMRNQERDGRTKKRKRERERGGGGRGAGDTEEKERERDRDPVSLRSFAAKDGRSERRTDGHIKPGPSFRSAVYLTRVLLPNSTTPTLAHTHKREKKRKRKGIHFQFRWEKDDCVATPSASLVSPLACGINKGVSYITVRCERRIHSAFSSAAGV